MKFTYPAVFKKLENGSWHGRFVDLAGLEVTGYSLDDAIRNAIIESSLLPCLFIFMPRFS